MQGFATIGLVAVVVFGSTACSDGSDSAELETPREQVAAFEQTTTVATSTTVRLDGGPVPEFVRVDTNLGNNGQTFEIYFILQDANDNPLQSVHGANLELIISDLRGNELYEADVVMRNRDLSTWTYTSFGNSVDEAGFYIPIPIGNIERSLSGSHGTVGWYLDFGSGLAWDYETETALLPTASEAEQAAADNEAFLKSATEFSDDFSRENAAVVIDTVFERGWVVEPKRAGCYELFDTFGNAKPGIRVDLEVGNASLDVETFNMDALLETPSGFLVEESYDSSLFLMDIPGNKPDNPKRYKGFYFFEGLDCVAGEYRFMLSEYSKTHMDISFDLPSVSGRTAER